MHLHFKFHVNLHMTQKLLAKNHMSKAKGTKSRTSISCNHHVKGLIYNKFNLRGKNTLKIGHLWGLDGDQISLKEWNQNHLQNLKLGMLGSAIFTNVEDIK